MFILKRGIEKEFDSEKASMKAQKWKY
jgi:hypothetical protein